ncbi:hypothetical protein F2Q70_00041695 [Brassica cretica]|uniref:Uncharacterized protein n=1 Tax=Brassica cretica TaxID=69181 RepID=A0A8S9K5U2_BRACR|nr:hypothetical protein F2Q70_00041695 [Brassica cretica]
MDLAAAALCIGFASLMKFSSISKKMTCELLRRAIPVNDLKGLGEFLENNKIENPAVVVHGTVGSNSTVENSRLGVFVKERASLELKKMKLFVSAVLDSSSTIIEGMASLELKKMNLIVSAVPDSSRTIIKETDSVKFEKTKLFDLAVQESKTIFVSRKGSSLLLWSFSYSHLEESERKKPVRLTHAIPGESKTLEYESNLTLEQSDVASSMISATWE